MASTSTSTSTSTEKDRQRFFATLDQLAPLSSEARAAISQHLVTREHTVGAWLLEAGERAEWCHFITSGLVRELYIDDRGVERTRVFVAEGQTTGSLLDLLSGEPSVTWIQALEPTRTLAWRYAALDALCERHAELHVVHRRIAERLYLRKARREHELLTLDAGKRHARWLEEHAALDARVTRQHLASYLGMTPEHLSRLRPKRARRSARPAPTR